MPVNYKTAYGLDWQPEVPGHQIELYMARFQHLPMYQTPDALVPGEHFLRAIRMLFTPDQFTISPWAELIVHGFCGNEETVLVGCASANKSHTCGLIAPLDWITAPHVTTTFFCSTDKAALEKRSWASVTYFYSLLEKKGIPAIYSKSRMAILNKDDAELEALGVDAPKEVKSGLFAVASMAGSEQQAQSKFIGVHQPHEMGGVRMFADEAQAVRQSFLDARSNLMIGTSDFRLVALGNPFDFRDPLGRLAEPEKGWGSVTVDDERWRNKSGGIVIHFDGMKSPAIKEPDKYPFLINSKHIKRVLLRCRGDEKHADYLTMVRGWIASASDIYSVFSAADQRKLLVSAKPPRYLSPPLALAGFDPAFTADNDNAALVRADLASCDDGKRRLVFRDEPFMVSADRADDKVSLLEARCTGALRYLASHAIPLYQLAVDESGTQTVGSTLAMMQKGTLSAISGNPYLVSFNEKASKAILSAVDPTPAQDRYYDTISEGWALMELYARFDMIRGLPEEVASQFANRRWQAGKFPRRLETKREYRDREGHSPDAADAAAVLLLMARHRFGFVPGGHGPGASAVPGRNNFSPIVEEMAAAEESLY